MKAYTSVQSEPHEAILSSAGGFTAFSFGGYYIRFRAPFSLERYVKVLKWENGYLVVLTKYKPRQTLAVDMRESIAEQAQEIGTRLFDTFIREGVAVEQAQAMQQSLFDYAPNSNPAKDYMSLFEEMGIQ